MRENRPRALFAPLCDHPEHTIKSQPHARKITSSVFPRARAQYSPIPNILTQCVGSIGRPVMCFGHNQLSLATERRRPETCLARMCEHWRPRLYCFSICTCDRPSVRRKKCTNANSSSRPLNISLYVLVRNANACETWLLDAAAPNGVTRNMIVCYALGCCAVRCAVHAYINAYMLIQYALSVASGAAAC